MTEVLSSIQNSHGSGSTKRENENNEAYLLSWLTIVAPVVGMHIPLLYYKSNKNE
jgi:hypothetical protein